VLLDSVTVFSYILGVSDLETVLRKIQQGAVLKVQEVEMVLRHWGFVERPGKGSHRNWKHPRKPKILTVAVHGKDLPRYITRELKKLMQEEV
jgi:predicted RNA binding protein YcfA (HicA-like mRNA interferase family)